MTTTDTMKIGQIYGGLQAAVVDLEKDAEGCRLKDSDMALSLRAGAVGLRKALEEIKKHFGHTYAADSKIVGGPCSVCGLSEGSWLHST
jgi:hypothetical protein